MKRLVSSVIAVTWLAAASASAQMDPWMGFHDEDDMRRGSIAHHPELQPGWRDFVGRAPNVTIESDTDHVVVLPKSAEALRACMDRCENAACIDRCTD